MEQKAVPEELS